MNKMLQEMLTSTVIDKISNKLGSNTDQTKSAMEGLLPAILGGLAKNTAKKEEAEVVKKVLKDHDGSVMNNLDGLLNDIKGAKGDKILGHILGEKTSKIESVVGKKSGLGKSATSTLMEILAPMVMGSIGKEVAKKDIGADMLSGLLKGSMKDVLKEGKVDYTQIATMFLDKDGDGEIKDDLMTMGKKYLKKFMG